VSEAVGEAVGERLAGGQPSRVQSFLAAAAAGLAVGVLTYKVLRGGGGGHNSSD
jgi:hypothetical protein